MRGKFGLAIKLLVVLSLLLTSTAWADPSRPEVGGDCRGAWVKVIGGHNKLLTVWIDGLEVFKQKVSDGFEKSATMEQLGLDPCIEHKIKAEYADKTAMAKFGGPYCCPAYPEVDGNCERAWVRVVGGLNEKLVVWIDGVEKWSGNVSDGFEASRTLKDFGLDPCVKHTIKAKYRSETAEAQFGGPRCCPVPCWPRLNIWVDGCIPQGLVISGYFEFDASNYGVPTGKKYIDKPWEKNPFIVDLDKNRTFRFFGWTAQGGFVYLFDVTTTKECVVINNYYHFPCPVPTPTPVPPTPTPVRPTPTPVPPPSVLPPTGGFPPQAGFPVGIIGAGIALGGTIVGIHLKRRH